MRLAVAVAPSASSKPAATGTSVVARGTPNPILEAER